MIILTGFGSSIWKIESLKSVFAAAKALLSVFWDTISGMMRIKEGETQTGKE
jgi:hypothetical protein